MKSRRGTPELLRKKGCGSVEEEGGILRVAVKYVDIMRKTGGDGGLLECN